MKHDKPMPLKILFVSNSYTPYSGGVVSSLITSKIALERLGHNVSIATLDFNAQDQDDSIVRLHCPISFSYKNNPMALPWRPSKQLQQYVISHKPDIVHAHHPFLLGSSAQKVCKNYGIPLVATYHTLYEEYAHYVPVPKQICKPIIRYFAKAYCNKAQAIIAPSKPIMDYLQKQKIGVPITVIPSSIKSHFLYDTQPQKNQHDRFTLLYVGRFVPEKNLKPLIELMAQLDSAYHLIMAGYGYQFEELKSYAQSKQIPPQQITFVHKPTQEQLVALYRTADLFLFPSQTDTQGLVLAEAMAAATPVVAFDGPGQRALIRNSLNGYIVSSLEQMRATILDIAHNADHRTALQHYAWLTAQEYRPHIMGEKLEQLYKSLL